MSLEEVLAEQTAAIREQTQALVKLTTAFAVVAAHATGVEVPAVLQGKASEDAAPAKTKQETVAEKMADTREPPKTRRQKHAEFETPTVDPANKPPADSGLPEGERDKDYYDAHVRPILMKLVDLDKPVVKALVEKFGQTRADAIPAAEWDELVIATKALTAEVIERNKRLKAEAEAEAEANLV